MTDYLKKIAELEADVTRLRWLGFTLGTIATLAIVALELQRFGSLK